MKSFAAACVLLSALPVLAQAETPRPPLPGDSVYQLRASLTDSTGRELAWRDLRGMPRVSTMFYGSCRYICPLVIDSIRSIDRRLSPAERRELTEAIGDYRSSLVPLIAPLTLIRHYVDKYGVAYLSQQAYFAPCPKELMLRNYVSAQETNKFLNARPRRHEVRRSMRDNIGGRLRLQLNLNGRLQRA